jgi:phage-related protein
MATFTAVPSYSSSLNIKPVILEAKFGDGYEQAVGDGINNKPRAYDLQFNVLTVVDGDAIEAFFDTNDSATTPFDWTPPNGTAGRFKCREHSRDFVSGFTSNINCVFDEVFF